MLPFTADVLFSLFEQYNLAIWPAQIVAYGLGLAAVWLTLRPTAWSGRLIAALLAAAWLWIGAIFHLRYFAAINFSAPAFGALFIVEGLLLAWTGVIRGKLVFRFRADLAGWAGLGLVVAAMALYPLLGWLAGHFWPRAPMFGVAASPTTMFTLGLLLLIQDRTPAHLSAIPVLWSLVAGASAWALGIPEDLVLPLAGPGGLGVMLWKNRRQP